MASTERCANCGKQGDGFKRCTICKDAHYCGPACQKDDWKHHKKKCTTPVPIQLKDVGAKTECTPPVPLVEFRAKVDAARKAKDWRAVLKYEGQLEEMLNCKWPGVANIPDWMQRNSAHLLTAFSYAHHDGFVETGKIEHTRAFHGYAERLIPMLGELQHFRDQADAMCMLSRLLGAVGRKSESATWFQRARDVGAANGFFSLESKACVGLGNLAFLDGRHEEAEGLMRNALVAAELNEMDDPEYELYAISPLIKMLFETSCIDEVEPLVLRYREAAMGYWKNGGIFSIAGVDCFICSARLHEVICSHNPFLNPLSISQLLLAAARPYRMSMPIAHNGGARG
jgi:hypothetical protein